MADRISPAHRSWTMSRIRARNTTPEIMVRSLLHRMGYRFTLRRKGLPGTPDIVLPRHRAVVFVHGCFWHRHPGCRLATRPKTRKAFWGEKFARNVARDRRNQRKLREAGWRVFVVWECQVRADPRAVARRLDRLLSGTASDLMVYPIPDRIELQKAAEAKADYRVLGATRPRPRP